MLEVSTVEALFYSEKLVQFALLPLGHMMLTVRGCLHGKAQRYFGAYCERIEFQRRAGKYAHHDESWLLVPTAKHSRVFIAVIVGAWIRTHPR